MPMINPKKGANMRTRNTFKIKNTLRKQTASTMRGNIAATLSTLQASFMRKGAAGNIYALCDIPKEDMDAAFEVARDYLNLSEEEAKVKARADAKNEWIAGNAMDFWNEIYLLYGICMDYHRETYEGVNQGFPKGYNYRFPGQDIKNGFGYMTAVTGWMETQMDNVEIFPESEMDEFPPDFIQKISVLFKRMNRIYIIMYATCLPCFTEIEAIVHLNTSYKHFYYFVKRYGLMTNKMEFEPLKTPEIRRHVSIDAWDKLYAADRKAHESGKK